MTLPLYHFAVPRSSSTLPRISHSSPTCSAARQSAFFECSGAMRSLRRSIQSSHLTPHPKKCTFTRPDGLRCPAAESAPLETSTMRDSNHLLSASLASTRSPTLSDSFHRAIACARGQQFASLSRCSTSTSMVGAARTSDTSLPCASWPRSSQGPLPAASTRRYQICTLP